MDRSDTREQYVGIVAEIKYLLIHEILASALSWTAMAGKLTYIKFLREFTAAVMLLPGTATKCNRSISFIECLNDDLC